MTKYTLIINALIFGHHLLWALNLLAWTEHGGGSVPGNQSAQFMEALGRGNSYKNRSAICRRARFLTLLSAFKKGRSAICRGGRFLTYCQRLREKIGVPSMASICWASKHFSIVLRRDHEFCWRNPLR